MILPCEIPAAGPAAAFAARMQAMLPVLDTEGLRLRAPAIADFPTYAEIALSPRDGYLVAEPTHDAAWLDFCQMVATWTLRGHGVWTVEARADGAVTGFVLLGFEPGDHEPELGYMFRPEAEGRGLAREAAEAARDHAFGTLGLPSLVSTIDHDNARSARLAERLGALRDARAEAAHGDAIRVYRHPAPERLDGTQLAHGIEMEIGHYRDPLFKPKGWALD